MGKNSLWNKLHTFPSLSPSWQQQKRQIQTSFLFLFWIRETPILGAEEWLFANDLFPKCVLACEELGGTVCSGLWGSDTRMPVSPRTLGATPASQPTPSEEQPPPIPLPTFFIPFPCPICSLKSPFFNSIQLKQTFMEQSVNVTNCAGGSHRTDEGNSVCIALFRSCHSPLPAPNLGKPVLFAFFY